MMSLLLLSALISLQVLLCSSASLTPATSLTSADRTRMQLTLTRTLDEQKADLEEMNAAISGLIILDDKFFSKNNKYDNLCQNLKKSLDESDVASIFFYVSATSKLSKCQTQIDDKTVKLLQTTLSSSSSTAASMMYAGLALKQLQKPFSSSKAPLTTTLKTALGRDKKSVLSQAQLLLLASEILTKTDDIDFFLKAGEELVATADEVDGRYLQLETGLIATDFALNAIQGLNKDQKSVKGLNKQQALKLANYLLERKQVQSTRGIYHLLNALNVFNSARKDNLQVPLAIQVDSNVLSTASPKVVVRVSDVWGQALSKDAQVIINKAARESDGLVVVSKSPMKKESDGSFSFDLISSNKTPRGHYELSLKAETTDKRIVVEDNDVLRNVKVVQDLSVVDLKVGILDSDESVGSGSKLKSLSMPSKTSLKAQSHSRLVVKFGLSENEEVSQAFVRLYHPVSKSEIIYLAESVGDKKGYKFDLEISESNFDGPDGQYEVTLIIGDALMSKAIQWQLADLSIEMGRDDGSKASTSTRTALPEIKHMFRQADPRPPVAVSNLFTGLVLVPFFIMLVLWLRLDLRINFGSLFSLTTLGFHLGLGAIFVLYYFFWLQLNMFQTIKYLAMVGVVTFLCGNAMLVKIADRRK